MTSQPDSSLSEDKEWLLVYIACLQFPDSSAAPSALWETLVFLTFIYSGEVFCALFQHLPTSHSHMGAAV